MDEARLHSVAEELNIPHIYTDFAAMCADPELDGVVIVSPSFLHVEQIKIAMEHGKHVFCEKPLGIDVAQCKEAEKVVEAHPELVFQLGFMRRFAPSYAEAKRRVDAGEIGKLVLIRSYTQDPRSTIESTLKFAPHSGGQFLDMCVHDLVRWHTAFLAEMQAFTDHIRNGTHPADLTVYDGTAVSEAAYRCKESFETGKMLPIR